MKRLNLIIAALASLTASAQSLSWNLSGNQPEEGSFLGSDKALVFKTNGGTSLAIAATGITGIGSFGSIPSTPLDNRNYRLFVKGGIRAEKVRVDFADENNWADYVFSENYRLQPLTDVGKYISAHRRLPDVPSAEEVSLAGVDVAQTSALLLRKTEELMLYIIEQDRKISALREQNRILREAGEREDILLETYK